MELFQTWLIWWYQRYSRCPWGCKRLQEKVIPPPVVYIFAWTVLDFPWQQSYILILSMFTQKKSPLSLMRVPFKNIWRLHLQSTLILFASVWNYMIMEYTKERNVSLFSQKHSWRSPDLISVFVWVVFGWEYKLLYIHGANVTSGFHVVNVSFLNVASFLYCI